MIWEHENFEYRFENTQLMKEHHIFGPLALFNYYAGLFGNGQQLDLLKLKELHQNAENDFDLEDIKVLFISIKKLSF